MAQSLYGVTKFKPAKTPRTLDAVQSQRQVDQRKTVQRAQSTVLRSKQLMAESAQIVADIKRRTGS